MLRRRPSPALVIACIALFVSLSGVSYGVATGFIDSREIKNNTIATGDVRNNTLRTFDIRNNTLRTFDIRNNEIRGFDIRNSSVQGRDLAFNTVTGADIAEDSLGKVPSATAADSAGTVGGMRVQKFFAKPAPGAAAAETLRGDFFVLEAGCSGAGSPLLQVDGVAGAAATNLTASTARPGGMAPVFVTDASLVAGDHVDLLQAVAEGSGTATVSTTSGAVATIAYAVEDAPAFAGEGVCAIRGTVTVG